MDGNVKGLTSEILFEISFQFLEENENEKMRKPNVKPTLPMRWNYCIWLAHLHLQTATLSQKNAWKTSRT